MKSTIQLGDEGRDRISGMRGVCTGKAIYLYGHKQVLLSPKETKDGAPVAGSWLDEERVDLVEVEVVTAPESAAVRAGGPVANLPPVR